MNERFTEGIKTEVKTCEFCLGGLIPIPIPIPIYFSSCWVVEIGFGLNAFN